MSKVIHKAHYYTIQTKTTANAIILTFKLMPTTNTRIIPSIALLNSSLMFLSPQHLSPQARRTPARTLATATSTTTSRPISAISAKHSPNTTVTTARGAVKIQKAAETSTAPAHYIVHEGRDFSRGKLQSTERKRSCGDEIRARARGSIGKSKSRGSAPLYLPTIWSFGRMWRSAGRLGWVARESCGSLQTRGRGGGGRGEAGLVFIWSRAISGFRVVSGAGFVERVMRCDRNFSVPSVIRFFNALVLYFARERTKNIGKLDRIKIRMADSLYHVVAGNFNFFY